MREILRLTNVTKYYGRGSVVTKDIPSGVVAAGNPCRVLRKITAEDTLCWEARAAEYDAETAPPSL